MFKSLTTIISNISNLYHPVEPEITTQVAWNLFEKMVLEQDQDKFLYVTISKLEKACLETKEKEELIEILIEHLFNTHVDLYKSTTKEMFKYLFNNQLQSLFNKMTVSQFYNWLEETYDQFGENNR